MPKNFSQKGFTNNFLQFMKDLEQNRLCCLDFLTRVYTQDSSTVTFTGLGTKSNPLVATAAGGGSAAGAAGTGSIKLDPGTLLATPEDGTLEYDGTHLYFTIGATRTQIL